MKESKLGTFLELIQVTELLVHKVRNPLSDDVDARESQIAEMEKLLKERELLIANLDHDVKDQVSIERKQQLMQLSQEMELGLERNRDQIKRNINQMKQKKKLNRKYDNPYTAPTQEGIFFDKRE
ncbi:flagellar protein FliT [Alkalihalobacillus pseudalcaliphilus]|uniref:flagellar protein FliT n=1 Tax=Alkalihalobacillus pseudalcaliphilus TaxID=79884 RepID=UPI00064D9469|nr:flagellar protein FliT [Alkalihalobacillus pseudalcaliphilus]KMK77436.1 hypothetical protein AB990_02875 [Alkalihalobacillus pseudalcaliphilus]